MELLRAALLAGAALASMAGSAWAADDVKALENARTINFVGCDGYEAPTRQGDGVIRTRLPTVFWSVSVPGTPRRMASDIGKSAVARCDAALADLAPDLAIRRAILLRARAAHWLEANEPDRALADLDEADRRVAAGDGWMQRSLGLGDQFLRVRALVKAGRAGEARALAARVKQEQPFQLSVAPALRVAFSDVADEQERIAGVREDARLRPELMDVLFSQSVQDHRWADVVALYPQLHDPASHPRPDDLGGAVTRDLRERNVRLSRLAVSAGPYGYALAAQGRAAEARAALAEARRTIETDTAPPPADSPGEIGRSMATIVGTLANIRRNNLERLDYWNTATEKLVTAGEPRKEPPRETPTDLQIIKNLVADFPDPETGEWMAGYHAATLPLSVFGKSLRDSFGQGGEGYSSPEAREDGVVIVRFKADKGTEATTREMALLRAAEMAKAEGARGMIIVERYDQRTQSPTAQLLGFETELRLRWVDPAAPPVAYAASPWRVIDPEAVLRALGPVYRQAAAG